MKRIEREKKTVEAMIRIYCKKKHGSELERCISCHALYEYACTKIENCNFIPDKPVCAKCRVHCYRRDMRNKIKEVMRFSGPKMIWWHPILLLQHIWDSKKSEMAKRSKSDNNE